MIYSLRYPYKQFWALELAMGELSVAVPNLCLPACCPLHVVLCHALYLLLRWISLHHVTGLLVSDAVLLLRRRGSDGWGGWC